MKNVNEPTRDSLGLRILWNSSSSLVFSILVLNRGPEGGGAIKIPFLRWALALPPPYLPPPPPPPPPSPPPWRHRTHPEPLPLWWPRWQCTLAISRQLWDNFDTTLGQLWCSLIWFITAWWLADKFPKKNAFGVKNKVFSRTYQKQPFHAFHNY